MPLKEPFVFIPTDSYLKDFDKQSDRSQKKIIKTFETIREAGDFTPGMRYKSFGKIGDIRIFYIRGNGDIRILLCRKENNRFHLLRICNHKELKRASKEISFWLKNYDFG